MRSAVYILCIICHVLTNMSHALMAWDNFVVWWSESDDLPAGGRLIDVRNQHLSCGEHHQSVHLYPSEILWSQSESWSPPCRSLPVNWFASLLLPDFGTRGQVQGLKINIDFGSVISASLIKHIFLLQYLASNIH